MWIKTYEDLQNFLTHLETFQEDIDDDKRATEPWICDTPEKANWILERLMCLAAGDAQDERVAREQIARAELWLSWQKEKRARRRQWLEACLEAYARSNAERTGSKTLSLPYGKTKLRLPSWKLRVAPGEGDEDAALAWLEANQPELVRVKIEPDIAALKKLVAPPKMGSGQKPAVYALTGEEIPGLETLIPQELDFAYVLFITKGEKGDDQDDDD